MNQALRDGVFAIISRGHKCTDCGFDRWELRLSCFTCDVCYKCNGTSYNTPEQVKEVLGRYQSLGQVISD